MKLVATIQVYVELVEDTPDIAKEHTRAWLDDVLTDEVSNLLGEPYGLELDHFTIECVND